MTRMTRRQLLTAAAAAPVALSSRDRAAASPRRASLVRVAPGVRLHAERRLQGGRTAIFLHGWSFNARQWGGNVAAVPGSWGWVTYDARNHFRSTRTGGYDFSAAVDDLHALLTRLRVRRPVLIGQSMGGMTALDYAVAHPGELSGLVLMATGTPSEGDRRPAALETLLRQDAAYRTTYDVFAPFFYSDDFRSDRPDLAEAYRRRFWLASDNDAIADAFVAFSLRRDLTAELPGLRVPTLVVGGEEDPLFPPERNEALAAAIPGAELVTLPGGHMVNLEQPVGVNRALRRWLRALQPPG